MQGDIAARVRPWPWGLGLLAFLLPVAAAAADLTARQAAGYVGKAETVCGTVASATHAERTKGKPTFLNLDEPYPRHIFTIVIWGTDRPKFGAPEASLMGRRVCVTGRIETYKGKPQIVVADPRNLKAVAR